MSEFDPKLKAAMREIEGVLKRYDVGGLVNLASKTHGEFKLILPSWSLFRWLDKGEKAGHMKLYGKSRPEQTEQTLHLLLSCRDVCGMVFVKLDDIHRQLSGHAKIEHNFNPTFNTD